MLLSIAFAGLLLAAPADAERTVDDWLAAARAHEPGKLDEPAVALSRWPRDATFAAIDRASRDADVDLGVLTRGADPAHRHRDLPAGGRGRCRGRRRPFDPAARHGAGRVAETDVPVGRRATPGHDSGEASARRADRPRVVSRRRGAAAAVGRLRCRSPAPEPGVRSLPRRPGPDPLSRHTAPGIRGCARSVVPRPPAAQQFPEPQPMLDGSSDDTAAEPLTASIKGPASSWASPKARCGGPSSWIRRSSKPASGWRTCSAKWARPTKAPRSRVPPWRSRCRRSSTTTARWSWDATKHGSATPPKRGRPSSARRRCSPTRNPPASASSAGDLAAGRAGDALASIMAGIGPDAPADRNNPWAWCYRVHEPQAASLVVDLRAMAR